MELNDNGRSIEVNVAEQSDDWLISAAQEIATAAEERGLALSFASGVMAVEASTEGAETVLGPPTKESVAEQLASASVGYRAVVESLNGRRQKAVPEIASDEVIAAEFDAWMTEDKLSYMAAAQEADPKIRFTLVATPNVKAGFRKLMSAAKAFGKSQSKEILVSSFLYIGCSAENLSGTDPNNGKSIVFSLIPNEHAPVLDGTVPELVDALTELQVESPYLKSPSPLEAITYWQTLRAQGDPLMGSGTPDRTSIRHFSHPQMRFKDGWVGVPMTYINEKGSPCLAGSSVQNVEDLAILAIG